ncbi:MAG TPA: hypothetical protein ENN18_08575 [Proteobacteria bacterium]|nr:hypothetical protein [Pseudomonadota bacterium]
MTTYDKWSCLERAQSILSKGGDSLLRYACLELRFCMEAITYEKLNAYSGYVPTKVFKKWQPNHALKMLLQFEPHADEEFSLCISPEPELAKPTGNWTTIGEHRAFKLSWLNKNYNRLGSYLHMPQNSNSFDEDVEDSSKIRKELQEIATELVRILDGDISSMTLATRVQFKCQACDQISVVHESVLRETHHATCIYPECGAEYHVIEEDRGNWQFKMKAICFKCPNCGTNNWLESHKLDIGTKFKCRSCAEMYQIISGEWRYEQESKIKTIS